MPEAELEGPLNDYELGEFEAAFGPEGLAAHPPGDPEGAVMQEPAPAPDLDFVQEVADGFSRGGDTGIDLPSEGLGSSADGAVAIGGSGGSIASAADVLPALPPVPTVADISDPGPLGYCYMFGRSVMRVQHTDKKGSVMVKCYRHPACSLLLQQSLCPPVADLEEWMLAVPPPPEGATAAARQALAKEHIRLGHGKWRRQKP